MMSKSSQNLISFNPDFSTVAEHGEGEDDVDWGKLKKGKARGKDEEGEQLMFKLKKVEKPEPQQLVSVEADVVEEERERVGFELKKRDPLELQKRKSPAKKEPKEEEVPEEEPSAYQRQPKEPKVEEDEPKTLPLGKAKVGLMTKFWLCLC